MAETQITGGTHGTTHGSTHGELQGEALPPLSPEVASRLDRLDRLARLMDSAIGIPGTRFRLGLDGILGLVPGVGDAATVVPAAYILWHAHKMGAPRQVMLRLGANTAIDLAVGAVPVLGDLFDIGFKANRRNVRILREHFGAPRTKTAAPGAAAGGAPGSRTF